MKLYDKWKICFGISFVKTLFIFKYNLSSFTFLPATMLTIFEKSFSSFFTGVWENALSAGVAAFSTVVFASFLTDLPNNNNVITKKDSIQGVQ